jgi:hypothetical protein
LVSRKYHEQKDRLLKKTKSAGVSNQPLSYDLSSVCHMINAAEPVDLQAISAFYEDFTPFGLRSGVIIPTYGLAEHTVYVCSAEPNRVEESKEDYSNGGFPTEIHPSGVRCVTVNKHVLETDGRVISAGDAIGRTLVSCGNPSLGETVDVQIVDTATLSRRQTDEVQIDHQYHSVKGY